LFVPTSRNASELLGKPLIYLDDVLSALQQVGTEICGIINSDIVLDECLALPSFLRKACEGALVYGQRVDVNDLTAQRNGVYYFGRDYFFFEQDFIKEIPASNFCIGAPWWDIWVPLVALHTGRSLIQPSERFALHVIHSIAWSEEQYCKTSLMFFVANKQISI